jgi:hypothetical protein
VPVKQICFTGGLVQTQAAGDAASPGKNEKNGIPGMWFAQSVNCLHRLRKGPVSVFLSSCTFCFPFVL